MDLRADIIRMVNGSKSMAIPKKIHRGASCFMTRIGGRRKQGSNDA